MVSKQNISHIFSIAFILVFLLAVARHQTVQAAGVRFAMPAASGTGDCSTWENACTLQTALTGAISGEEIWAAVGTYKPSAGTDRAATFQLVDGVAVYGGFAGTETLRSQRDPAAHVTILSGDIDNNDSQSPITNVSTVTGNTTNSYHVVTGATGATLDGFTITGGYASDFGGGMYNDSSSPTLMNIIFMGNIASDSPSYGGGMYNSSSNPVMTNVTFSGNSASYGGGILNFIGSHPTLTNVTFSGNTAGVRGGGLFNSFSTTVLTNVTFSGNSAGSGGGGIYNAESTSTLTNTTFSGNSAPNGGAIFNYNGAALQVRNSILWGNTASNGGAQILDDYGTATVSDSVVEGGYASGTNILTADPVLGTLGDYGGFTQTIPLLAGSSAINTGNDSICPATDQRGATRPQGGHCDIGAYEVQTILLAVPGGKTSGLCQSWADACELRYALTSTVSGQEIWTAAGTYKPTAGTERSATFQLIDGVAVYGGFAGTETAREQRNPAAHVTILSGDLNGDDAGFTNNSENTFNIVTGATGATLDGFTITAGNANGSQFCPTGCGGGMVNGSSSPALKNVIFSGNSANYGGGMADFSNSSPTLSVVTFNGNSATYGGGVYNEGSCSPTLTDVTLNGNSADYGAGMYNTATSNSTLTNVTISDNSATKNGGGMYNGSSNPTIINATFSDNSAEKGGALYNSGSNPTIKNVTFKGNSATDHGGGMFIADLSYPEFHNAIFWGNTAAGGIGAQIYNFSGNTISSDSVVQGGCADTSWSCGTNILTTDPKLGTLGNYGGFTQTIPLLAGSSAIDAGNDAYCPATDQRGIARPQGFHCDIGAYETDISWLCLPLIMEN